MKPHWALPKDYQYNLEISEQAGYNKSSIAINRRPSGKNRTNRTESKQTRRPPRIAP